MPNSIALSGQLPNDEKHNGLLGWVESLVDKGRDARLFCLVVFDVPKITLLTDDGSERPIVRLVHIEPVSFLEDAPAELVSLLARLGEERSGGQPLPGVDSEDGSAVEVYATGPEDDEARGKTLRRKVGQEAIFSDGGE